MVFSSYEFLFLFLPLVLILYYALPRSFRTLFLTAASYLFYGWWDYRFCGLMLLSTCIDYFAGLGISRAKRAPVRRAWMFASIASNLLLLGFFKYYDLFASTINQGFRLMMPDVIGTVTNEPLPLLHVVLPVGISFYTFQSMSYAIDLYRGIARPTRSFIDFACYVSLFPQLVAGPIVRYSELADQLIERKHSASRALKGATIFIVGFAKKVLIADSVAPLVDYAFGSSSIGLCSAWIGVTAYAVQIYFDFSGYSDMAVGLGLLFGFQFPKNFNSPYQAVSVTDFWRRWHISLSSWLRDYLYIPLGGNRISISRTYINLVLVMLLGGLWHGANWTFLVWGGMHGFLLAWERYFDYTTPSSSLWAKARTFIIICLAWVPFRAESLDQAFGIWLAMIGLNGNILLLPGVLSTAFIFNIILLIIGLLLAFMFKNSWSLLGMDSDENDFIFYGTKTGIVLINTASIILLFLFSVGVLLVKDSSPFLYFQF